MRGFLFLLLTLLFTLVASAAPLAIQVHVPAVGAAVVTPVQPISVGADGAMVTIQCDAPAPCAGLSAKFNGSSTPATVNLNATGGTIDVKLADLTAAPTILVISGSAKIVDLQLVPDIASGQGGGGQGDGMPSSETPVVADVPLPGRLSDTACGRMVLYDRRRNVAQFVVTSNAAILSAPAHVDENDRVIVHVYEPDDLNLLKRLQVARTSATRVPTVRVAGSDTNLSAITKQAAGLPPPCRSFSLGDFQPTLDANGEGAVEIRDSAKPRTDPALGGFKFTVDPLYAGILSFGPVFTRGPGDQEFILEPLPDNKNAVIAEDEGHRNVLYAVQYTYFMWGQRDFEQGEPRWYAHVNPTIGMSINKPLDHALLGASIDIGQFIFTFGSHVAHVNRLSSDSGLTSGSVFTGTKDNIPTARRWVSHAFVSVAVDLRAAATLLKAVTSAK